MRSALSSLGLEQLDADLNAAPRPSRRSCCFRGLWCPFVANRWNCGLVRLTLGHAQLGAGAQACAIGCRSRRMRSAVPELGHAQLGADPDACAVRCLRSGMRSAVRMLEHAQLFADRDACAVRCRR